MVNNTLDFKSFTRLRMFCMKVLPTVYSDVLSYDEQVCKLTKTINDMITTINGLPEYIEDIVRELIEQAGLEDIVKQVLADLYFINVKNPPQPLIAAKGDGATNDTSAIQALINYAKTKRGYLFFPAGNYIVNGITMVDGVSLVGLDRYLTIISLAPDSNKDLITGFMENSTISNITLNANMNGQTANCSCLNVTVENSLIDNVIFKNGYDSAVFENTNEFEGYQWLFDGIQHNALTINGDGALISGVIFRNASQLSSNALMIINGRNNITNISSSVEIPNGVIFSESNSTIQGEIFNANTPFTNASGNYINVTTQTGKYEYTNQTSKQINGNSTTTATGEIKYNSKDIVLNPTNPLTYKTPTELDNNFNSVPMKDQAGVEYEVLVYKNPINTTLEPMTIYLPKLNTVDEWGSMIIVECKGNYMCIDSGLDTQYQTIKAFIRGLNITTFTDIVITHFHTDHAGCMANIITDFATADTNIYFPMSVDFTKFTDYQDYKKWYDAITALLASKGYDYVIPTENADIKVLKESATANFFNLNPANLQTYYTVGDYNNCSMGMRVYNESGSSIFTGDMLMEAQNLNQQFIVPSDVFMIPHHNVNRNGSAEFIANADPSLCFFNYQVNMPAYPRYINKVMKQYVGVRPIVQPLNNTVKITLNGSVRVEGGSYWSIDTSANAHQLLSVFPWCTDYVNSPFDYNTWSINDLLTMSKKTDEVFNFILLESSNYYSAICAELKAKMGGTGWNVQVGYGKVVATLFPDVYGEEYVFSYLNDYATRYVKNNVYYTEGTSELNLAEGASGTCLLYGNPMFLLAKVTTGSGTTEVILQNINRDASYIGYALYNNNNVYVNVSITGTAITVNACKYNNTATTLVNISSF